MDKQNPHQDYYALYRHFTFFHTSYFLLAYFQEHSITKQTIIEEANLSEKTLKKMLEGQDVKFDCYLRLLSAIRVYCTSDEEYLDFITEFIKRALIEIWLSWEEQPNGWMTETWEEMQKEKERYEQKKK